MGRLARFCFFRCHKLLRTVGSGAGGIKMPSPELPSTYSVHRPISPRLAPFLGFLWGGRRKTCWLFLRRVCWWCVSMKARSVPFPKAASRGFHCCLQNASMYRCTVWYLGVRLKFCRAVGQQPSVHRTAELYTSSIALTLILGHLHEWVKGSKPLWTQNVFVG